MADLGPAKVWHAAKEANAWWLAISLIPLIGRYLIWGWKWQIMMDRYQSVPYKTATQLIFAGCFVNQVTPTARIGGGILRALTLHKAFRWPKSTAFGWSVADQIASFLGSLFLFGAVSIYAAVMLPLPSIPSGDPQWVLLSAGVLAMILPLIWLASRKRLWERFQKPSWRDKMRKLVPKFIKNNHAQDGKTGASDFFRPILHTGNNTQIFSVEILLSALSFQLLCLSNAYVFRAMGSETAIGLVTMAVMLAYLGGSVLGLMGGIGVTELFLIELFSMAGISREIATAGALLHRFMFYLVVVIIGGFAAWRVGNMAKNVPRKIVQDECQQDHSK